MDSAWRRVLELASLEESGMDTLLRGLAAKGVPAPVSGYELNDDGWQADLAWPQHRVAVVLAPNAGAAADIEAHDRDAAFAAAGWDARPVKAWNIEELAAIVAEGAQ
jgi:hypothetical protein